MVQKAAQIVFDEGWVKADEGMVITAGIPIGSPGTTNMLRIAYLDENGIPDGHAANEALIASEVVDA